MLSSKRPSVFKISSLLICLMGFLLGSCSDNSHTNLNGSSSLRPNHKAKQTIIKYMADNYPILYSAHLKYPGTSRKKLCMKLSPTQQYKVWKNHFHDVLDNVSLTKEQKLLLEKFDNQLSPNLFAENADRSDFINDKKINKIKDVFGKGLAGDIFVSLKTAPEINKDRKRLNY